MKGGISNGSCTVVVHMFQNLDPVIRLQGQVTGVSGSIRIESRSRGQGRRCLSVSRGRYRWTGILLSRGRCLLAQCGIGKLVRRRGIRCRGRVRRRRRLNRLKRRTDPSGALSAAPSRRPRAHRCSSSVQSLRRSSRTHTPSPRTPHSPPKPPQLLTVTPGAARPGTAHRLLGGLPCPPAPFLPGLYLPPAASLHSARATKPRNFTLETHAR